MKARGLLNGFCSVVIFFIILSTVAWAAEPVKKASRTGVLKVGASAPLSGIMSPWGIPEAEIAALYADVLNEDGGIIVGDTAYKLVFIKSDDKATPDGIKASGDRVLIGIRCHIPHNSSGYDPMAVKIAALPKKADLIFAVSCDRSQYGYDSKTILMRWDLRSLP